MSLSCMTEIDIQKKIAALTARKFTGESALRFYGDHINEFHTLPKEIRWDERPGQDASTILNLFILFRDARAFGAIYMIWREGLIRNYAVRLTFQGEDASLKIERIFKGHSC